MNNKFIFQIFILITIICLIINSGCRKNTAIVGISEIQKSHNFKIIKIDNITRTQHIDSIIQDYYYLPLETNKDCLIGRIDKIICTKDRIYVLDGQTSCIYVFRRDGSYNFKICNKGSGPGEYDAIMDFELLKPLNQLIVLCTNFRKLIFYDSKSGEYIKEKKMGFGALAMAALKPNKFLFDCKLRMDKGKFGDFSLAITDSSIHIQSGYFPRVNYPSTEKTPFTKYRDFVYYCSNYSNDVFAFKNDVMVKKYTIDFGKRELNLSKLPNELFASKGIRDRRFEPFLHNKKFKKYLRTRDIAYHVTSFLESNSIIKFNFIYGGNYVNALHNKNTGITKTYLSIKQDDDFCIDVVSTVFEDYFIGNIDAAFFEESSKRMNVNQREIIKQIFEKRDLNLNYQNPVLIFIKYKNF